MEHVLKSFAVIAAMLQLLIMGSPALAQQYAGAEGSVRTVATESWVEEWDPATGQWVPVEVGTAAVATQEAIPTVTTTYVNGMMVSETREAARFAHTADPRAQSGMLAQYGPFIVTGPATASMVGATDGSTPAYFDAMLRDFPQLTRLDMIEAPGTSNDIANLAVGRRIREAGIATHVPRGGSVRSGAVELFLAGSARTMDQGAQFAVHSWLDNHGREADDFASDHPAHRLYLDYYVEMGMSERQARDFYNMTNSVPHHSALWLGASDMQPWLRPARTPAYRMAAAARAPAPQQVPAQVGALVEAELPTIALDRVTLAVSISKPALDYTDISAVSLAKLDRMQLDSGLSFP